ncbi:hypothetical protein ACFW9F_09635 [Streptomyces sp. NPDC059506]|uniref:hypothetical protein n=1 Tax=unclassified Streptomyces TaxID=2593676 RepID=UPI0022AB040B|nr:hypothetical protein [Streptomyces sp. HB2AG]MCZ2528028.1 hypothetical protein [Streptomyces sp. HB2AG]
MSEEVLIDPGELRKLGKLFESYGYDLRQYLKDFKEDTDAETIHDGFGVLTESEEVTSAYIELAKEMSDALEGLHRHLDDVGRAMCDNAKNTEAADDALGDIFKGNSR